MAHGHAAEGGRFVRLEDIDLLDRDEFARGVPHHWFAHLREHAPVYRHPEPGGRGFWVVTRHEDVVAIGRDSERFSSDAARGGVNTLEDTEAATTEGGRMMLWMDPPDHTRYRMLVNRAFTPRVVRELEEQVRRIAADLLDRAIARDRCDVVVDVAAELPMRVIAELLGVPAVDHKRLVDWTNRMIGSEDPEYLVGEADAAEAKVEMFLYAQALADERRVAPRSDLVSALLCAEVDGEVLSAMELNLFFMLLSVAGGETTRNALAHGILAFVEHPDQYQRLLSDPSVVRTATEEILRWASPVMFFRRNVTADTELRGQRLAAGDKVSMWYVSANRDETAFEQPFRFDIAREGNEQVAFGGGGPHHCLGANLARMEIRVVLEELASRGRSIELAGPVERLRSNFLNGIKHLPVRFT